LPIQHLWLVEKEESYTFKGVLTISTPNYYYYIVCLTQHSSSTNLEFSIGIALGETITGIGVFYSSSISGSSAISTDTSTFVILDLIFSLVSLFISFPSFSASASADSLASLYESINLYLALTIYEIFLALS